MRSLLYGAARLLGGIVLGLFGVCYGGTLAASELRLLNWSDYVDPRIVEDFTRETGIRVVYDTFDQIEMVETRLLAGRSGYDLVVATGAVLPRLIAAGAITPIDRNVTPNLRHLSREIDAALAVYDPGNRHAVAYLWGTTGIGVRLDQVRRRLLDRDILPSWSLVFDPAIAARLADCGISMLDAGGEIIPAALIHLGRLPHSEVDADIEAAANTIRAVRPYVRRFHSSDYINGLANGTLCLVVGYSGDILQARRRATEAGATFEIAYIVPREGALLWIDAFVVPTDAPNAAAAHRFIDFLNRPDIAARNVEHVRFASGNESARAILPSDILEDPAIYPPQDVFTRLITIRPYSEPGLRLINRTWQRVTTGR